MTDGDIDVYVLGTGMVGYRQLTKECEQALNRVGQAYMLHPLPEVREFVHDRCETVVDLTEEYESGLERAQSYDRMARRVVGGATDADDPVALVVYGHPTVGVTPTGLVRTEGAKREIEVRVLPGVSSLDALYADFSINPLDRGLQVYEATDLLVYNIELDPATPALLMQIGLTGTRLYDERDSTPRRFAALESHLTQWYPPDHAAELVRAASLPFANSERTSVRVNDIGSIADQIDDSHTLWIPPAHGRTVQNEEIAANAYSEAYLDSVTDQ